MDLVKISNPNVLAMISPMSSERVNGIARYAREHGWNLMIRGIVSSFTGVTF